MIDLSLLICSLHRRKTYLDRLLSSIIINDKLKNNVEIVIECDNGEITIGKKRNLLLEKANGSYIAFIDDDDFVEQNYVESIFEGIKRDVDVIGMKLLHYEDNILKGYTHHSLKYNSWWDEPDKDNPQMRRYYRNPNHLNPVKKEFAIKAKFPEINYMEDREYSKRLLPFLKTEWDIDNPIYRYYYRTRKEV